MVAPTACFPVERVFPLSTHIALSGDLIELDSETEVNTPCGVITQCTPVLRRPLCDGESSLASLVRMTALTQAQFIVQKEMLQLELSLFGRCVRSCACHLRKNGETRIDIALTPCAAIAYL